MTRFFSRFAGAVLLLTGIVLSTLIVLGLILSQLIGEEQFADELRCRLGLSDTCLRAELQATRRDLAAASEEFDALKRRSVELEAIYDRLRKIEHASSAYVIFTYDTSGSLEVVSGHEYKSLIEPEAFTKAWCYASVADGLGTSRQITLGRLDAEGRLTTFDLDDEKLRQSNLSLRDVTRARRSCHWPEIG